MERGNVTSRAVLGPRDLGTGVLVVTIIEGRVESIGPDAASSMQPKQFLSIFPGVQGSVLQLRDIEQGLEQLNRLPSNNAAMRIEAGGEAGANRVLIENVQKRAWRLSAGVDNLGQETTGLAQYTLGFEEDNFLGCDDQAAVDWASAMPRAAGQFGNPWEGCSDSLSALFSVPLGYWLLSGSASRFNAHRADPGPARPVLEPARPRGFRHAARQFRQNHGHAGLIQALQRRRAAMGMGALGLRADHARFRAPVAGQLLYGARLQRDAGWRRLRRPPPH